MTASLRVAPAATTRTTGDDTLGASRFIALVTFRRTGVPVSTPVLCVADGERILVRTAADTGKVKRIRHTPDVQVVACDSRGRLLGTPVAGRARILGPDAVGPALDLLHAKYRLVGRFATAIRRLRGQRDVILEIVPG